MKFSYVAALAFAISAEAHCIFQVSEQKQAGNRNSSVC